MIELNADIWEDSDIDVICVTTNGTVKSDGCNIMGGGIALEAARRIPNLPKTYGELLTNYGLHVQYMALYEHFILYQMVTKKHIILAFPTKYEISQNSSTKLIQHSLDELITFAHIFPQYTIGLPRPGVGLGGLNWETTIKPIIDYMLPKELDDRIIIYDYAKQS